MSKVQLMLEAQAVRLDDPPPDPSKNGNKPDEDRPGKGADKPHPNPAVALRPPVQPPPPPPRGPFWRWVRHGAVRQTRTWRPRWLLGLLEVVTHPPAFCASALYIEPIAPSCGLPGRPALLVCTP